MNLITEIKTKNALEFNKLLAEELKKLDFEIPEWFNFVKTGVCKERIPDNSEWYYNRMASILRYLVHNPVGINKIKYHYSALRNRGSKPDKVYPSSGNIARKLVQLMEKKNLLKLSANLKGRYTCENGRNLIKKVLLLVK